MNFRIYLVFAAFIVGCGVKSNPTAPTKEAPPSLIQELLEENQKKPVKQKNPVN